MKKKIEFFNSETIKEVGNLEKKFFRNTPANVLIVAPHPDDEVLGCGGMIQKLKESTIDVFVLFVTKGDASHPKSMKYPPEVLAKIRKQEAIDCCSILGVPEEKVLFLGLADGTLNNFSENQKHTVALKINDLLTKYSISTMLLPWRRDPHPDHRASYTMAKMAAEKLKERIFIIEYPIWLWKNSEPKDWPSKDEVEIYKLNIEDYLSKKEEGIYAHKSQTSHLIKDDPEGFILTPDLLAPFKEPWEYFFVSMDEG